MKTEWVSKTWAQLSVLPSAFPPPLILFPGIAAFALTGPFGTYELLGYLTRLAYWGLVILGCGAAFNYAILVVLANERLSALPRVAALAIASALATPVGGAIVYVLDNVFRGGHDGLDYYVWLCVCVFGVGMAITLVQYWRPTRAEMQFAAAGAAEPSNGIIDRIKPDIGDDILSMSMQDHYVEVVTEHGTQLVHTRFSDAVVAVADRPGLQCHRSHWVALDAIADAKLTGRSKHVVLTDGRKIPVSARYAGRLDAALASRREG